MAKPDLAKPDLAAMAKPDLAKPGLAKPDLAKPGLTKPGFQNRFWKSGLGPTPGLAKPGFTKPVLEIGFAQTGFHQTGFGNRVWAQTGFQNLDPPIPTPTRLLGSLYEMIVVKMTVPNRNERDFPRIPLDLSPHITVK